MASVHARAARASGAELVAVASSTPERAVAAAGELGFARAAVSVDDLLTDETIDIVHVCTPNVTHETIARHVLDAGRHVICEKPLTVEAGSARELARLAASSGLVATVPFVYRFHPMVREARARVRSGEAGRLLHLDGRYLQDWLLTADDGNWRVDTVSGGASRAFADIGSHLVDLVEFVTGERIEALHAMTGIAHATRGGLPVATEDTAHILVRLESGCHGVLAVSQVAAGRKNALRVELFGTEAAIAFDQESPDSLTIARRSHTSVVTRDAAALSEDAARLSIVPAGHPMGYQDAFTAFVRDTYEGVRSGLRPEVPTFDDGARAAMITDAVLRSAASATWIDGLASVSALQTA